MIGQESVIRLTDLVGLDELQKIQDSFALATDVGACIHEAADNEGKWVSVNLAFERIMGYSAEEVLGKETAEQPLVQFYRFLDLEGK